MTIRLSEWDGVVSDHKAVKVNMWYDRHLRLWEVWTVDSEGNQWEESRYSYSKAGAVGIKKELEKRIQEVETQTKTV